MSDYVTRLFREALGRLEGEYRGEGLDAMALAARSLAADESKSYAAAHAVLDEGPARREVRSLHLPGPRHGRDRRCDPPWRNHRG